jgi:hypothetical protein
VTLERLNDIARQMSDNEFAERMVKARSNLFQYISPWDEGVAQGYSYFPSPNPPEGKKNGQSQRRGGITITPLRSFSGSFFD